MMVLLIEDLFILCNKIILFVSVLSSSVNNCIKHTQAKINSFESVKLFVIHFNYSEFMYSLVTNL
jgi:hypothetical protein